MCCRSTFRTLNDRICCIFAYYTCLKFRHHFSSSLRWLSMVFCYTFATYIHQMQCFFVTVRAGTAYRKIWRLVNNFCSRNKVDCSEIPIVLSNLLYHYRQSRNKVNWPLFPAWRNLACGTMRRHSIGCHNSRQFCRPVLGVVVGSGPQHSKNGSDVQVL